MPTTRAKRARARSSERGTGGARTAGSGVTPGRRTRARSGSLSVVQDDTPPQPPPTTPADGDAAATTPEDATISASSPAPPGSAAPAEAPQVTPPTAAPLGHFLAAPRTGSGTGAGAGAGSEQSAGSGGTAVPATAPAPPRPLPQPPPPLPSAPAPPAALKEAQSRAAQFSSQLASTRLELAQARKDLATSAKVKAAADKTVVFLRAKLDKVRAESEAGARAERAKAQSALHVVTKALWAVSWTGEAQADVAAWEPTHVAELLSVLAVSLERHLDEGDVVGADAAVGAMCNVAVACITNDGGPGGAGVTSTGMRTVDHFATPHILEALVKATHAAAEAGPAFAETLSKLLSNVAATRDGARLLSTGPARDLPATVLGWFLSAPGGGVRGGDAAATGARAAGKSPMRTSPLVNKDTASHIVLEIVTLMQCLLAATSYAAVGSMPVEPRHVFNIFVALARLPDPAIAAKGQALVAGYQRATGSSPVRADVTAAMSGAAPATMHPNGGYTAGALAGATTGMSAAAAPSPSAGGGFPTGLSTSAATPHSYSASPVVGSVVAYSGASAYEPPPRTAQAPADAALEGAAPAYGAAPGSYEVSAGAAGMPFVPRSLAPRSPAEPGVGVYSQAYGAPAPAVLATQQMPTPTSTQSMYGTAPAAPQHQRQHQQRGPAAAAGAGYGYPSTTPGSGTAAPRSAFQGGGGGRGGGFTY